MKLIDEKRIIEVIEGPIATEEIPHIISKLTNIIEKNLNNSKFYAGSWSIVFCEKKQHLVQVKNLQCYLEAKSNPQHLSNQSGE